ncbi:hypothetical protein CVT25_004194 [Psilocybe cyanescens]|uniref:Uncharacterized protein n=1 Tax=Psilocybe cyanescens TaxID=93625 RepID=A0A409X358_PSICY|nr:hypothetical protein CVT25_004194 [Psilocybe cyanescens]
MPFTFPSYNFVIPCLWACLYASLTAASPLISTRDADSKANDHISSRVIKLMVVAALLFVSLLLALYLYSKCKPRARAPSPMYNIPHTRLIHPAMGTRPNWRITRQMSTSSVSSSSPLVRMTSPSGRTIVPEEIILPTKAYTKARRSSPTAGVFPV